MYKGIYIALSGAIGKQQQMDMHAQNIANAATTGFKKEAVSFKNYLMKSANAPARVPDGRSMSEVSGIVTDFSKGTIKRTGNPLDLAINGEGFFALEDNMYTRSGNFEIDSEGYLVTHDGVKVLGDGGPITVQGEKIDITESGEVFIDDVSAGNISVLDFPDKSVLTKVSGTMFASESEGEETGAVISQGYLESSNVEVIKEMVHMLTSMREFESYQKIIHALDDATSKTNNELGR